MPINQELEEGIPQSSAALAPPRPGAWVKGQSGNPRGRPSRARQASRVATALIQRQTVPLTNKTLELALAGDRMLLRELLPYIAAPGREPPIDLALGPIANRDDLRAALTAVVDAVANGGLTAAQAKAITPVLIETWRYGRS